MPPGDDVTPGAPFQPDIFFLARTEGQGLVRDLTGRLIDRCVITSEGVWEHDYGALSFVETYVYESGPTDVLRWRFAPDAQGRMSASEGSITEPVRGWSSGQDYHLRFRRKGGPRSQGLTLTYNVRFTLMRPDVALKVAKITLFGVTLGRMVAIHRRIAS